MRPAASMSRRVQSTCSSATCRSCTRRHLTQVNLARSSAPQRASNTSPPPATVPRCHSAEIELEKLALFLYRRNKRPITSARIFTLLIFTKCQSHRRPMGQKENTVTIFFFLVFTCWQLISRSNYPVMKLTREDDFWQVNKCAKNAETNPT